MGHRVVPHKEICIVQVPTGCQPQSLRFDCVAVEPLYFDTLGRRFEKGLEQRGRCVLVIHRWRLRRPRLVQPDTRRSQRPKGQAHARFDSVARFSR